MTTIYELKRRTQELSAKKDSLSISPEEVGGLIRDLTDYVGQVETDGGTLGIRKIYPSIAAMEVDAEPIGLDERPLKRGNLVGISDGKESGKENGRVYAFQKPGWLFLGKIDAGYATRFELEELQNRTVVLSENEYDALQEKDSNKFYYTYEEE